MRKLFAGALLMAGLAPGLALAEEGYAQEDVLAAGSRIELDTKSSVIALPW